MESDINDDPMLGEDTLSDHNNIEYFMKVGNLLKILKLVLLILNTSYFVGITFLIFSDATR